MKNWALLDIQGLTGTDSWWAIFLLILVIIALILVIVVYIEIRKERKILYKLRDEIRRTT